MRGLSADKGINTIHEYLNSTLEQNSDGTAIEGAGTLVSDKVAKNTVSGNLANGSAKDQIDYWNDVALPVVVKRDGRDAVANLQHMTNPADFFLDPARMELALYVLTSWFAAGELELTTAAASATNNAASATAQRALGTSALVSDAERADALFRGVARIVAPRTLP